MNAWLAITINGCLELDDAVTFLGELFRLSIRVFLVLLFLTQILKRKKYMNRSKLCGTSNWSLLFTICLGKDTLNEHFKSKNKIVCVFL